MPEEIHVHIHTGTDSPLLLEEVRAATFRLETRMAALDDKLDSILGHLDRLDEQIRTETQEVTDLRAERDALRDQITAEGITPERQAKLDEIDSRLGQTPGDVDNIYPPAPSDQP